MVAPLVAAGIGAAGNIIGNLFGASGERKAARMADARIREGVDYATNRSGLATTYAPGGAEAFNTQRALLTGGPEGDAAFQNFLGSTGFRNRLKTGTDAITGNAAARGMLKSGATLKGLNKFGQGIASDEFGNYFGQLGSLADKGYGADSQITAANTGGATAGAGAIQSGYGRAASRTADAISGGAGIAAGAVRDIWG